MPRGSFAAFGRTCRKCGGLLALPAFPIRGPAACEMNQLTSIPQIESHPGGAFRLRTEVAVAGEIEDVFEFFSDARNLESITPPWLRLRVLTPRPIDMSVGTRIRYRFRVRGIPARWHSEITAWEPPLRFVDEQRCGPFRYWLHEHTFLAREGKTIARDDVCYRVPGGRLLHGLFVRKDLERLFSYRHAQLIRIFASVGRQDRRRNLGDGSASQTT
jgi:ligand-binding SRPBCC domain-containing protein